MSEMLLNELGERVRPAVAEVLGSLKACGYRFNIIKKIDHRFELFYEFARLDGRVGVHFVAELDGFGNVTDWGPYAKQSGVEWTDRGVVYNADGDRV